QKIADLFDSLKSQQVSAQFINGDCMQKFLEGIRSDLLSALQDILGKLPGHLSDMIGCYQGGAGEGDPIPQEYRAVQSGPQFNQAPLLSCIVNAVIAFLTTRDLNTVISGFISGMFGGVGGGGGTSEAPVNKPIKRC